MSAPLEVRRRASVKAAATRKKMRALRDAEVAPGESREEYFARMKATLPARGEVQVESIGEILERLKARP